ncbi:MAG: PaaI family thioesterase [Betaproteobacteria bacterium]|nr:MAG: PaaI family thioesterase [Betaproteobacteria bacterium]
MALRDGVTLDILNQRGTGRLPGLVGFRVTAFDEGRIDAELDIRPDLLAPNGYLHAATVIALADTACGYGCVLNLPEGATGFTTAELKSNFIGTALEGTIATVARAAHLGNSTQIWDAVVTRKTDHKTIALFRCTQLVLYAKR